MIGIKLSVMKNKSGFYFHVFTLIAYFIFLLKINKFKTFKFSKIFIKMKSIGSDFL